MIGTTSAGKAARQVTLSHGVLSSGPPEVHFGLGADETLARLEIHWPDGSVQVANNLPANHRFTFQQPRGSAPHAALRESGPPSATRPLFREFTASTELVLASSAVPAALTVSVTERRSALASRTAFGDADADQDSDVFIAGASNQPAVLLLNRGDGTFARDGRAQPWDGETGTT